VSTHIHSTAIVGKNIELGNDVTIGPYVVIDDHVFIGDKTRVESHATIHKYVKMGENNHIYAHADIGGDPQDIKYEGGETWLDVGDNNIIREYATIHRSSIPGEKTIVGNQNFIMAYAHIGHNCLIGNQTFIVNSTDISGHVEVEDKAFVSGGTVVHQFVKIGSMCMIGGGSRIIQDVLPYTMVVGNPATLYGLNIVGLRRNNVSAPVRQAMKQALNIIKKGGNKEKLVETLSVLDIAQIPEILHMIEFIKKSNRGLLKKHS